MCESNFIIAQRLAFLASDLDNSRGHLQEILNSQVTMCVMQMHEMARALADEQVGEIYYDDD